MTYTFQIDNAAFRLFRKLPKDVQKKMIAKAKVLEHDPLRGAPLKGKYQFLRSLHLSFKGTAYRIIYQVFPKTSTVVIRLASSRENIYRKLSQMKIKPLLAKRKGS